MSGPNTDAVKEGELRTLAMRVGLPLCGAGYEPLSYSQLFRDLNEWIRNAKAERANKHAIAAAWISAATAMIAVIMSIVIHIQTRQLLIPAEKPLISLVDSNCKGEVDPKTVTLTLTINAVMKNVGNHPAERMRIRVWGAPLSEPNDLKSLLDVTCADPLFPDIPVSRPMQLEIKPWRSNDRLQDRKSEVFYYMRTDYQDLLRPGRQYTTEFHLTYKVGNNFLSVASIETADKFKEVLSKIR